ncbi:hypothetical protein GA840_04125 [Pediococcus ethanolidurans]|uniref:hypothetical protein n=1 Tax=Pediococcus ethanolidurans TaxID=319653 RepID=UPI0029531E55|nr:hypothetical protein [Pediococcus ethanolidurans]MDV7719035.1 hypothetical protein [Pediococcus ethanolidurans]
MRGLLKACSELVRFNAAKDILDCSGNGIAEAQTCKTLAETEIAEARAKTLKQDASDDGQVNIIIDVPDKEEANNG